MLTRYFVPKLGLTTSNSGNSPLIPRYSKPKELLQKAQRRQDAIFDSRQNNNKPSTHYRANHGSFCEKNEGTLKRPLVTRPHWPRTAVMRKACYKLLEQFFLRNLAQYDKPPIPNLENILIDHKLVFLGELSMSLWARIVSFGQ